MRYKIVLFDIKKRKEINTDYLTHDKEKAIEIVKRLRAEKLPAFYQLYEHEERNS